MLVGTGPRTVLAHSPIAAAQHAHYFRYTVLFSAPLDRFRCVVTWEWLFLYHNPALSIPYPLAFSSLLSPKACAPGLMRSLASQIRVPASAPSCARNCMSSRRANSYIILSLLPLSLNCLLPKSLPLGHALRSDDVRPQVLCGHSCWCSLHRPVCLLRDPSEAFRRVL